MDYRKKVLANFKQYLDNNYQKRIMIYNKIDC